MDKILFYVLLMILFVFSCSPKVEKKPELIYLNSDQIEKFIKILPDILKFSDEYFSKLSPAEETNENINDIFIQDMMKSKFISNKYTEVGFKDQTTFFSVYYSIIDSYTTLLEMGNNYTLVMNEITNKLNEYKLQIQKYYREAKGDDKKSYSNQLIRIYRDEIRVSNLIILKNYMDRITKIEKDYYSEK